MSPTEIIDQVTEEGVLLALSPSGGIIAKGAQSVIDRWLPAIKQSKAAIIDEFQWREFERFMAIVLPDFYTLEIICISTKHQYWRGFQMIAEMMTACCDNSYIAVMQNKSRWANRCRAFPKEISNEAETCNPSRRVSSHHVPARMCC